MATPIHEPKHVACARCRDRKVKCDGGRPSCKRCSRNGTTPCRYVRGRKQNTRIEWLQHLRTFSSQPGTQSQTRLPCRLLTCFAQVEARLRVARVISPLSQRYLKLQMVVLNNGVSSTTTSPSTQDRPVHFCSSIRWLALMALKRGWRDILLRAASRVQKFGVHIGCRYPRTAA